MISEGIFTHRIIPFGLMDIFASYQRCMAKKLAALIGKILEIFVDDIAVYGTWNKHLKNLEMLQVMQDSKLSLNLRKSSLQFV